MEEQGGKKEWQNVKFRNLLFPTYIDRIQSSRVRYGGHLVFVENIRNTKFWKWYGRNRMELLEWWL